MQPELTTDAFFLELGRTVYLFQAIEARIKFLLPHLAPQNGQEQAEIGGLESWRKYLDSKEMLGNLVRLFQERVGVQDSAVFEQEWRAVVQGRNDAVHAFILQPFARCQNSDELAQSIEYLRARRRRALPMLQLLDLLLRGFATALKLPPDFDGEVVVELPDWYPKSAA